MNEHPERAELSAWLDGELPRERRQWIDAHVAGCPHCARIAAAYRANDRVARAALARQAQQRSELPAERVIERARTSRRRRLRIGAALAAAVAAVAVTAALVFGPLRTMSSARGPAALARNAIQVHVLTTAPDAAAARGASGHHGGLAGWLSDVLGRPVGAPELERMGYHLVDARRLGDRPEPAAVLQFSDRHGRRITCYFADRPGAADFDMSYLRDGAVGAFYAVEDGLAYAVVGDIGRAALRDIARAAYESVERGYSRAAN